jgi:hypothetical protein
VFIRRDKEKKASNEKITISEIVENVSHELSDLVHPVGSAMVKMKEVRLSEGSDRLQAEN